MQAAGRTMFAVMALLLVQACAVPPAPPPLIVQDGGGYRPKPSLRPMRGTWTGTFACLQGDQLLKLAVFDGRNGVEGFAEFGAPAWNPQAGAGLATIRGHVDPYTGTAVIEMADWIRRPPGYTAIVWDGAFQDDGIFAGRALGRECSFVSLRRDSVVDPASFLAAEADPNAFAGQLLAARDATAPRFAGLRPRRASQDTPVITTDIGGLACWLAGCTKSVSYPVRQ